MNQLFASSVTIGVMLNVFIYMATDKIHKKFNNPLCNPIILTTAIIILILVVFDVEFENYQSSAKYLDYLLTPTTVCLAIPLYQKLEILKENYKAIFLGVISGTFAGLFTILGLSVLYGLSHQEYVTLLPKSVTTAIAIGITNELDGILPITIAAITITGILGNVTAEKICKLCKIEEPVAVGVAIGTCSHALGTAKAMELGKVQGAMSSLAIVIAGIITTVGTSILALVY